jgi:hypothetical protein
MAWDIPGAESKPVTNDGKAAGHEPDPFLSYRGKKNIFILQTSMVSEE